MKNKNIDNFNTYIIKLKELLDTNNIDELIYYYKFFSNSDKFISTEIEKDLLDRIINNSIILKKGDFFVGIDTHNNLGCFKYVEVLYNINNSNDLDTALNDGLIIRGIEFLKSGKLPKKFSMGSFINENRVMKILRGFNCNNELEEKEIYKKLILSNDEKKFLLNNFETIIINNI